MDRFNDARSLNHEDGYIAKYSVLYSIEYTVVTYTTSKLYYRIVYIRLLIGKDWEIGILCAIFMSDVHNFSIFTVIFNELDQFCSDNAYPVI